MKKKTAIAIVALVLISCFVIGGTLAWLNDQTDSLVNTFTYGDINITLAETTGTEYKMIPGVDISKDPKVTVKSGSEACWLFVKVEKSANFDTYMTYEMDSKWTALDATNHPGVYYYNGTDLNSLLTADKAFNVLKDNKVKVKGEVTKEMLTAFDTDKNGTLSDTEKAALPTLTITAYAVQKEGFSTAAAAWAVM